MPAEHIPGHTRCHSPSIPALMQAPIPLRSPGSEGRRKGRYNQRRGREGPTKLVFPLVASCPNALLTFTRLGGEESGTDKTSRCLSSLLLVHEGTWDLTGPDGPRQTGHL